MQKQKQKQNQEPNTEGKHKQHTLLSYAVATFIWDIL
jgi:hypothetical protein